MSSKPVGFQDITSHVLGYTINTSTPQCRWVADQIADLPQATQDEIYGRFYAVCNRGDKDAAKGRKYLYTSLDYAGLSQQLGKVATDITKCIKMLQLMAQKAPWHSIYGDISTFAHLDINTLGGATQTGIAAYVEKYDPLPPATPVNTAPANAASPDSSASSSSSSSSTSSTSFQSNADAQKIARLEAGTLFFAAAYLRDYKILKQDERFFRTVKSVYDDTTTFKEDQRRVLEIYDQLSPYAQLLVEQIYICNCPGGLSEQKLAVPMKELLHDASLDLLKQAMRTLISSLEGNLIGSSIMFNMKLQYLGKVELLALKAYLGFPRHLTNQALRKHPGCSEHELSDYISKNMGSLPPSMLEEFKDLSSEGTKLSNVWKQAFRTAEGSTLGLFSTDVIEAKFKKFLLAHGLFSDERFINNLDLTEILKQDPETNTSEESALPLSLEEAIFKDLVPVKKDIDIANQHVDLISTSLHGFSEDRCKTAESALRELISKLSTPARCMIEKLNRELPSGVSLYPAEQLRETCYTFFSTWWGTDKVRSMLLKARKLNEKEALSTELYMKFVYDFCMVLPRFGDKKPVTSEQEFKKVYQSFFKNSGVTVKSYKQLAVQHEELQQRLLTEVIEQGHKGVLDSMEIILNPDTNENECLEAYNLMPLTDRPALDQRVFDMYNTTFGYANKEQMVEACNAYLQDLSDEAAELLARNDAAKYGGKPNATDSNQEHNS